MTVSVLQEGTCGRRQHTLERLSLLRGRCQAPRPTARVAQLLSHRCSSAMSGRSVITPSTPHAFSRAMSSGVFTVQTCSTSRRGGPGG